MKVLIASNDAFAAGALSRCLSQIHLPADIVGTVPLREAAECLATAQSSLSLVFVVLPESWEDSQRVVETLSETTDAWIVPIGHLDSATGIVDLIQHGADGFIDQDRPLESQLLAIFQNLQRHGGGDEKSASQLIGVAAASGGSGASTIAANLAVAAAEKAGTCGLLDFDLTKGDLSYLLDIKPRHSIVDLCRNKMIDQAMFQQSLTAHRLGVSLLAAPQEMGDPQRLEASHLVRILNLARTEFPVSIVDFGSPASIIDHADLLKECDQVLMVLKLDFAGLCNTRRLLDLLERRSVDLSHVQLVANRNGMTGGIPASKAKTILGRSIDHCIPCDEPVANLAVNCGVPLIQEAPKSAVTRAIRGLSDSIVSGDSVKEPVDETGSSAKAVATRVPMLIQQVAGLVLLAKTSG